MLMIIDDYLWLFEGILLIILCELMIIWEHIADYLFWWMIICNYLWQFYVQWWLF